MESPTDTRNAKSPPDYVGVGKTLGRIFFEPDVWHEMIKLREFAPDGLVASEAAFARIAIIRDAIRRLQPYSVATQMLAGVDQYVGEAFEEPKRATAATLAIRLYEQNVSPLTRLADVLARRVLNSRVTAVEIAPVLKQAAAEAEQLMKLCSAMQKFSEPTVMDEFVKLVHERIERRKLLYSLLLACVVRVVATTLVITVIWFVFRNGVGDMNALTFGMIIAGILTYTLYDRNRRSEGGYAKPALMMARTTGMFLLGAVAASAIIAVIQ